MNMSEPQNFIHFVSQSPTAFHAVASSASELASGGFHPLDETREWKLEPGQGYYVIRNGSALLAFRMPKEPVSHFQIVASHADSPMFKLKPKAESPSASCYLRLNVEVYGGMICSTWLDRPLSIAGRLIVHDQYSIHAVLADMEEDCALIPNMPIHFNREINEGYKYNPQVDLLPLLGEAGDTGYLMSQLADKAGVRKESILDADLFLYNRMPGTIWGSKHQFFSCPRIDDLECAYTSLLAFLTAQPAGNGTVPVYALFDNEEVGSTSKQGANSNFLYDTLYRIHTARSQRPFAASIASSFMLSADNAHAVHPNHPEKYDEQNRVYMNKGVVIKHSANQKYTTDALSSAVFSEICKERSVPVQHFANRSDIKGGSTLGNIANTHTSMHTADIGLAQLAMHSSYETAGCTDVDFMISSLTGFYETSLDISGSGNISLVQKISEQFI